MEFSRQEPWRGLPFHPPGDLPDPGIEPMSLASPVLAGGFSITEPPGKPCGTPTPHLMLRVSSSCSEACSHGDTEAAGPLGISACFLASPGSLQSCGPQESRWGVPPASAYCLAYPTSCGCRPPWLLSSMVLRCSSSSAC